MNTQPARLTGGKLDVVDGEIVMILHTTGILGRLSLLVRRGKILVAD